MVSYQAKTMSETELILRLLVAALLIGVLACIFARWQWNTAGKNGSPRRRLELKGNPIDISPLRPRMEAVRRDYAGAAQTHARSIEAREDLVAAARHKLRRLPFFQDHPTETEGEHRAA